MTLAYISEKKDGGGNYAHAFPLSNAMPQT